MTPKIDLSKLTSSWTKYDIVQVMEVIYNKETLYKFKNKEATIDEPILRAFLGVKSVRDPLPNYWLEILKYPNEKSLFALFSVLFTHGEIIKKFADQYSSGDMKGVFKIEPGKEYTNLRSALIVSGAAEPMYRRAQEVPFDFSPIFQNMNIGKLFKHVLEERISRLLKSTPSNSDFYKICFENNFHKALSLSDIQFKSWLEGTRINESSYIEGVQISNFFCVQDVNLNQIGSSKEVYFLGENGDGKSLILMAIYLAFNRHFITEETDKEKTGKVIDLIKNSNAMELIGIDDRHKEYKDKNVGFLNDLFAYGTHRGRYATDDAEEYGFMSLFDNDQTLINPISWLKDQKLRESDSNNKTEGKKGLPSALSIKYLETMFYELLESNVEIKIEGDEVFFIEKGTKLSFDQLSEGYKSIVIFMSDLLYRLQKSQPDTKNVEELHGIVLVDEMDLHLHPKWQRVVVKKIRSLLPNVQFMFTTHSPTMIQGASEDAIIYRVYRNSSDGKTRVSAPYYRKELNHLMFNTLITSTLFGLENSRLDAENTHADTSDTYLLYRINRKLELELVRQKSEGKEFISDEDIDSIIDSMIKEELKRQ